MADPTVTYSIAWFLAEMVSGIVGVAADRGVCVGSLNGVKGLIEYLKQGGKPVNHDLQKALKRSFLFAVLAIASEYREELSNHVQYYRGVIIYSEQYRTEFQQLDSKIKKLKAEIQEIERLKPKDLEIPMESLEDIELLLTPEGTLAGERIKNWKEKLLEEALKDCRVAGYEQKLRKDEAGLFEQMGTLFADEIKKNHNVRSIFEGQLLAQINVNLKERQFTIQDIENALRNPMLGKLDRLEQRVQEVNANLQQDIEDFKNLIQTDNVLSPSVKINKLSNVPGLPPHFLEGLDTLEALKKKVLADAQKPVVGTGTIYKVGVQGMGGIGKSVLAAELAVLRLCYKNRGIVRFGCSNFASSSDIKLPFPFLY